MPQEISIGLELAPAVSPAFELGLEVFVSEVHPVSKLAVKLTASKITLTNLILLRKRIYPCCWIGYGFENPASCLTTRPGIGSGFTYLKFKLYPFRRTILSFHFLCFGFRSRVESLTLFRFCMFSISICSNSAGVIYNGLHNC